MGIYGDHVFPRLMDWGMRSLADLRVETLSFAQGRVLEVGFGTGLNLPHYPQSVSSLVALDPLDALAERVSRRIASCAFPVERMGRRADDTLPFEDGEFDTVVTTWTLCSIDDALRGLGEMRRVLRPGGLYLFIEHGRSERPGVARWQRRLNPIQRRIGCGCRLDRPIDELVRKAGFEISDLARFKARGPRILAGMYRGIAL